MNEETIWFKSRKQNTYTYTHNNVAYLFIKLEEKRKCLEASDVCLHARQALKKASNRGNEITSFRKDEYWRCIGEGI